MKKKVDFEEFKNGRKTYLVFPWNNATYGQRVITAAKRFHCTAQHIKITFGAYVVGDSLYFEEPKQKGRKRVVVAEYVRTVPYYLK